MSQQSNKRNRYYLMRHGESLANRRGLIVSHAISAKHDYGLTALGADQVMQSALSTRLDCDTLIVSSDFKRAAETADIMHSVLACNTEVQYSTLLRERDFGDFELSDQSNYTAVWQHDVNQPDQTFHAVEPVKEVLKRGLAVIDSLEQQQRNRSILLVGHGDVLQILLAHHHNINPRFHRSLSTIGNADIRSLSKLQLANRQPAA